MQLPNETIEIGKDVLEKAWSISPTSVYGVLVGFLLLTVVYALFLNYQKDKKLYELNVSIIEVLKDLNTSLLLIKEDSEHYSDKLVTHITNSREHISEKISNLEKRIAQ